MGKTGISVRMDANGARSVVDTFSKNEAYLRNLIFTYVPENTRERIDEMDYRRLLHYGHVIMGVAEKILKSGSKPKLEQLSMFS